MAPDLLDRAFGVGTVLKGLDGLLELLGGVVLLLVTPETLERIVAAHTRLHLPHDLSDGRFAAVYLLLHGAVKVVLVVALLRGQLWAYPWMIGFLLAFVAYQLVRLAIEPELWLVLLTIFDLAVAWLTWREYGRHRARL